MQYDVIIIGAGIVGAACAYECTAAGMRVAIIERGVPGGATTGAGMGHVVVMDDSPAQLALTRYSRSLWLELIPQLPPAVEYSSSGTLWVAADEEEMAEVYSKHAMYTDAAIRSAVLNGAQLAVEEPNLRPNLAGALWVPDDGVIYPPGAALFFLAAAQRRGAMLLRGKAVTAATQGRVKLADGTELSCATIVAACGVDTTLFPWLPVQKRKGHLLITDRYAGFVHHALVELGYLKSAHKVVTDSVAFNVQPRQTGQLLIGSSRQYGNSDSTVDQAVLKKMLDRAFTYLPALARLSGIRAWTGFRAATPDKLPLIGYAPDPTIFIAAGFEGLGITNAPGAARMLVDALLGRVPTIAVEPYRPGRFGTGEGHA